MMKIITDDSPVGKGVPEPHEGIQFQKKNVEQLKVLSDKFTEASSVKSCAEVISSSRQDYHPLSCSCGESDRDNGPQKSSETCISWKDRALQLEKLLLLSYEEIARYGGEADAFTHGLSQLSGEQRGTNITLKEGTMELKVNDDPSMEDSNASFLSQMNRQALVDTIHRALYHEKAERTTPFNGERGSSRFTSSLSPKDEAYLTMGCDASFPFREVSDPPPLPLSTWWREGEHKMEVQSKPFFAPSHPIIVLDISSMFSSAFLTSQRKTKALPIELRSTNTTSGDVNDVIRDPTFLVATSNESTTRSPSSVIPEVMHIRAENLNTNCSKSSKKSKRTSGSDISVESVAEGVSSIESQISDDNENSKHVISPFPPCGKQEKVIQTTTLCATTTQRGFLRKDSAILREKSEKQFCRSSSRVECDFSAAAPDIFTSDLQSAAVKEMLPVKTDQHKEKVKEKADFNDSTPMVSTEHCCIDNKKAPEFSSFLCRSTELPSELLPSSSFPSEDMKEEGKWTSVMVPEKTIEKYEREVEKLRKENSLLKYRERRRILEGRSTQDVPGTAADSRYLSNTRNCMATVHGGADRPFLKTFCESYIPISNFGASQELPGISCSLTPDERHAVGVPGSGISSSSPPSPSSSLYPSGEEMSTGLEDLADSFSPIHQWDSPSDKESELRRLRILMRFSYLKKDSDELEVIKKQMKSVEAEYQHIQCAEEKSRENIKKMLRDMLDIQEILSSVLSICCQKNSCSSSHLHGLAKDTSRKSEEMFLLEQAITMCKSFNSYSTSETTTTDVGCTTSNASRVKCDAARHRLGSHPDLFNTAQEGKGSSLGEHSECRPPSACVPSTNKASSPLSFPLAPFRFNEKPPMPKLTTVANRKRSSSFSMSAASSSQRLRSGSTASFSSSSPLNGMTFTGKTVALEGSRKNVEKKAESRWTSQSTYHQIARDAAYQCCYSGDKGDNTGSGSVPRIQQAMDDARALANVLHQCQISNTQLMTAASTKRHPSKS